MPTDGRAGEGHHVDVHVAAQRLARGLAEAGQHLQHAVGNAGLRRKLGDAQCGQRRLLGGLQDDRVAGGECGPQLPGGHHQRIVPRHHGGDDADRLARDEGDRVRAVGGDLVIDLVGGLGVPLDGLDRARNVAARRGRDGLAHVERFEQRQLVLVLGISSANFSITFLRLPGWQADHEPFSNTARAAATARFTSSDVAFRHLGQHPAVDGRDAVEGLARGRGHVFAVDEGLVAEGEGGDHGAVVGGHRHLRGEGLGQNTKGTARGRCLFDLETVKPKIT